MATGFAADVLDMLETLYLAGLAERVVYRPRSGAPRSVLAVVRRDNLQPVGDTGVPAATAALSFANDSADGVASREVNTGGDEIEFALRHGDRTAVRRRVTRIAVQTPGETQLEVQ
jgi:hypothetical protein